ncbi:hypothetical protein U3A55_02345 [Salarchaeum sp. III]|uniref:hypothetical protein n=1 Tax=Salarchaeum sp. III TaxID=3107927 RepID=UPI002ED89E3D
MADKLGFMLVPGSCMHYRRKQRFAEDRKVKVGRNVFFMMKDQELTNREKNNLLLFLEDVHGEYLTS